MSEPAEPRPLLPLILGWGFVSIPLAWGVYETLMKAAALFK